jgi:hypothetical protein
MSYYSCTECGRDFDDDTTKLGALIGLTGVARAGKDSVGRILVEERSFVRVSFADKLRAVALGADPYVRIDYVDQGGTPILFHERLSKVVEVDGWERAKEHADVRRLLQRLGTEGVRQNLGMDTWVDAAMADLEDGGKYVFTDVRFVNEAVAIHAAGGSVWRVERDGYGPVNAHASDAGLPESLIDLTIYNNWTLDDLRAATLSALGAHANGYRG